MTARQSCPWPIASVLPHAPPMIFLDAVLEFDAEGATAVTVIRDDHLFATPNGVPVHFGIELMAQTCGAYVGSLARSRGEPVKLGFILGTRRYRGSVRWFGIGDRLVVRVRMTIRDETMGVFECAIERDGITVAEAQLSVYQPPDAAALFPPARDQAGDRDQAGNQDG